MNLEIIRKIPYFEKKIMVKEACLMYKKINLVKKINENKLSDKELVLKNDQQVSVFQSVLAMLEKDEMKIILRDFIDESNPLWYLEEFSKTTYYKIKHQAIDNFLYLFYA